MTREEARKLWAEALRSGKYKQGRGSLKAKDKDGEIKYCCLGVACELYIEHVGPLEVAKVVGDELGIVYSFNDEPYLLPLKVMDWLDIYPDGKLLEGTPLPNGIVNLQLMTLNDEGVSFEEIARLIENGHLKNQEKEDVHLEFFRVE